LTRLGFELIRTTRKADDDEIRHRTALEAYLSMSASEINTAMRSWQRRHHLQQKGPHSRTSPVGLVRWRKTASQEAYDVANS
jgi:hypothetical protein